MTLLILGLIFLAMLSLVFLLWPVFAKPIQVEALKDNRAQENIDSFKEYIADLNAQLADGRISQTEYDSLKLERERALLEDESVNRSLRAPHAGKKIVLVVVSVICVAVSAGLYLKMGASDDVAIEELVKQKQAGLIEDFQNNREVDTKPTQALIAKLESTLKKDPENTQYWFLLARTYMELSDFKNAANAYEEVVKRDQTSAIVLSEAAQAHFLLNKQGITDQIVEYVDKALVLEPNNAVALGISGIIGFTRQDYQRAVDAWTKVLAQTDPQSPSAPSIRSGIERAKSLLIENGGTLAADNQISLPVAIMLGEGVELPANGYVFVYARAWEGSRMPLAILKLPAANLPEQVNLTEAMAMSPAATLATANQVEVVVRVSASGAATPQPGDWEGSVGPIDPKNPPELITVTANKRIEM